MTRPAGGTPRDLAPHPGPRFRHGAILAAFALSRLAAGPAGAGIPDDAKSIRICSSDC